MSAGYARGVVELDISQLEAAARAAQSLGRVFEGALSGIDREAKKAKSSWQSISDGIGSVRAELTALSVGSGILTGIGLSGARSLRNYTIAFGQFTESQEEAEALTERLISQANKYGLEWEGAAQLARALLPSLKEGAKDLDGWISRAARLRSLFPSAPRGSETIAISEFLAGQNMSLARRFNVPMSVINEATSQFDDLGEAMDYILDRRGATEEAALAMADSFQGVRNELRLLLAEGFTPLFNALQPILASFREWVSELRQSNPALAQWSAGLIALTAAGAPALLLFNQLYESAKKLKALGVLSALGKGGAVGLSVAAGVGLGIGATNAIGQATGNDRMANAGLSDLWQTLQKLVFNIAWTFTRVMQLAVDMWARSVSAFGSGVDSMLSAMARFTRAIASFLPTGLGRESLSRGAAGLESLIGGGGGAAAQRMAQQFSQSSNQLLLGWAQRIQGGGAGASSAFGGASAGSATGNPNADIIHEWAQDVRQIERDAANQRLDATRQYEQQRSDTIAQYELGIARDAEDFARARARAAQQLEHQIADVQTDAAKRDADAEEDYRERVTDLRDDTNERLSKLDEDYQRSREQAATDHRDRLLDAAGRLDAVAVREEQRRYARQQQDADDNYTEQRSELQQALDERLQEERESYQVRRDEQRTADAERIEDMRANLAEQQRLEDEDRAIAAQRRDEDYARQLQQQDTAHAERLAQISSQAAQERVALDEAFLAQLAAEGVHNENWLALQKSKQDASLALFDSWWSAIEQKFATQGPAAQQAPGWLTDFNGGRSDWPTETPPAAPNAGGGGTRGFGARTFNVNEGAIKVYATAAQSEEQVARLVERRLLALLEGME